MSLTLRVSVIQHVPLSGVCSVPPAGAGEAGAQRPEADVADGQRPVPRLAAPHDGRPAAATQRAHRAATGAPGGYDTH